MMEPWIIELLKQSPAIGAILAIVWMGLKWHERMSAVWLAAIDKIDERGKNNAQEFVSAIKDIGEKCHAAHDKNAQMFYEQSCNGQKVLTELTIKIALFADAVKDLRRG